MENRRDSDINIFIPTEKHPIKGWNIKDSIQIGKSSRYGDVMKVCKNENCNYVIKIISGEGSSHEKIKNEVRLQEICAEHNLCKPVEDWWLVEGIRRLDFDKIFPDNKTKLSNLPLFHGKSVFDTKKSFDFGKNIFPKSGGVIITPILKETLGQRIEKINSNPENGGKSLERKKYIKQAWKLLSELHQLNIIHGDSHYDNFMFDRNDNLFLIDMGKGMILNEDDPSYYQGIIEDYEKVYINISEEEEYFSIVLEIIKDKIRNYKKQRYTDQEAEKKVMKEILNMNDIDLDIVVNEYRGESSSSECIIS